MNNEKIGIKISQDCYGETSYNNYIEDINYLVNELDVFCDIANDNFENIVENEKMYESKPSDYLSKTEIEARGYSQSEWQVYTIYHSEPIDDLIKQLQRSFTHFNDYIVEKYEYIEKDGEIFEKEPHDYTSFAIDYVEFPNENDIMEEYLSLYGEDYDKIHIQLN